MNSLLQKQNPAFQTAGRILAIATLMVVAALTVSSFVIKVNRLATGLENSRVAEADFARSAARDESERAPSVEQLMSSRPEIFYDPFYDLLAPILSTR